MKIQVLSVNDSEKRLKQIKDIIDRGSVAVFTNKINGIIKKVKEFNPDKDGDLIAFYSSGLTNYVCPTALEYEITEEKV